VQPAVRVPRRSDGQRTQREVDQRGDQAELERGEEELRRTAEADPAHLEAVVGDDALVLGILRGQDPHRDPAADPTDHDADDGTGR
jgi:hypothetical protein